MRERQSENFSDSEQISVTFSGLVQLQEGNRAQFSSKNSGEREFSTIGVQHPLAEVHAEFAELKKRAGI